MRRFPTLRPLTLGYSMEYPDVFGMSEASALGVAFSTAQANGHYTPSPRVRVCARSVAMRSGVGCTVMSEEGLEAL
jgi:hypothetical protein